MLLPSDVARLVLGYLQEEGLSSTSQSFIHESPNLKEYAEHSTEDGTIPACVFSLFGNGLTIILNEYVATKTKESAHEVPAMMTSLWKKLDFTLNQIRSLQNSPSISAIQRTRSRVGVANMARQRVLTVTSAGSSVLCSSVTEASSIISPSNISHSILGHSTPVSYSTTHTRPAAGGGTHQQFQDVSRLLNTPRDSLTQGPMSPGRRKWDTPRKRGGAQSGSSALAVGTPNAEPQTEEAADENFPPSQQIVIQNARDKILGDRSLQEKLAENINKILGNEPPPQTSKAPSSTMEVDQSIDEILGLQGEIHMSDDAIHDILEQTESDPAFHALFELFDYNKTRFAAGDQGDGDISSNPGESNAAGPSSAIGLLLSYDPDTALRDANASDSATMKTRIGPERKTRKSSAPTLLKKVLGPSGRTSRIENSSARLLVSLGGHAGDSNRKQNPPPFQNIVFGTPMDIDEALHTPPPPSDIMDTAIATVSTILPSAAFALALPEATANRNQEHKQAEGSIVQPAIAPSGFLFPLQVELNNTPTSNADLPHTSLSSGVKDNSCTPSSSGVTVTTALLSLVATAATSTSHSTSAALTAALPSLLPVIPTSSCTPVGFAPKPPTTPSKAAADTSNIVSLEIIISDNQDEDSSKGTATNHALPSISGNKIPTIYLSSPVKSLRCPGTPRATLDEAALAVCGLQNSEAHGSPAGCKAVVVSPLRGTSLAQPNYIFQLPLDAANPELQGAATSYFILTEAPTADSPNRPVLLPAGASVGQPLPNNPFGVTIPTRSRGFSTVPALILPSPAKPMILPVSVMGPNSLGTVQVVSNQLVAIQNPVPVQPSEKPSSPTVALKQSIPAGTGNLVGTSVPPVLALSTVQQETAKASTHRRILCFESSAEAQQQTAKTTRSSKFPPKNKTPSGSVKQREKDNTQSVTRTKPSILSGNKPKRRIETVRCSADPQTAEAFMKEAEKPTPPQQKDPPKKISRKQDHSVQSQETQSASTSMVEASQTEKSSKSARSSKNRKHSHDKEGDGAKAKESRTSRSSSGTRKEKEDSSRKEPTEKASGKTREGRSEKKTPSQEIPNVTANKENEIKGSVKEQPSSSTLRDPPAVPQPASQPQPKASKAPSKTSSLAKQAAEMLQDIQGLNSPSTPGKRPGAASTELPRTPGRTQEESADRPWTPSRLRKCRDGEGTPKHLLPPNTPDVPTCSPASEAGSENSINMAAHTLMILSRAAIARTGTPLKDSLRQEEVGEHSPTSSKISKKRKLSSPTSSPQAKKETKQSSSKTTEREKKKLVDCFPLDLDVDKFLSSLHYDE
ncbi:protein NPAT [Notothenia coriiceps]|uniref:Protein NPAT n=1 Tax=Notothenia coriiceps TaxID=8208 RepID=A0A6I9PE16_9TELE|nr:PREDICTED: protein NPAT [Notothenia coriiceps]